ncbi:MAG: class I tRNA ligase family protein, partial [Mameliella sp.]|nr:class I tRNA ligase family protein [Phaeodactylibacter sp.]
NKRAILEPLVLLMAPFAPFTTEDLWSKLGHKDSVHKDGQYPAFNPDHLKEDELEYPIAINGKTRATASFPADTSKEDLEAAARELESIQKWIEGKTIRKVIVVPKRMINIVVG